MTKRLDRTPPEIPGDHSDPHGLPRAVADYLQAMRVRGFSETTLLARTYSLIVLLVWLTDRGITRPTEVTRPILESYQRHLYHRRKQSGAPLSFRTQHTHMASVKMLFRYLARQNRILFNPAADLEMPRFPKRLPRDVLTVGEVEQMMEAPDLATPVGMRNRAILEVFYSTGIRRRELVRLAVHDFDFERGTLMVREGKFAKDRMVPIGERAVYWALRYLDEVRDQLAVEPDEGIFFLTSRGEMISLDQASNIVTVAIEAAGLGKGGSCHLLRHTMATLMRRGGARESDIQEMLGHANPASTRIYTRITIQDLKAVHNRTHPGANRHRPQEPGPVSDNKDPDESKTLFLLEDDDDESETA